MSSVTSSGWAGLVLAVFCFVLLPELSGRFWLSVFTSTGCFVVAVAGVAFIYARLGMVSLTQVGLMGVGGWVTLRLGHHWDAPFEVNLLLAGLVSMLFGVILALPALRMRGLYLALVTLMAAGGLDILFASYQFPNGGDGFWGVALSGGERIAGPVLAQSAEGYLRFVVVIAVMGFLLIEAHNRSKPGRAWAMIRRSEAAAIAAGVNVTVYKLWAFGICGLLGGLAGGLLAGSIGVLDSATFRATESIMLFVLAVVGGSRYWLGVVIAAALYKVLPALLNTWGVSADLSYVIFGAGLLHAVITAPDGIAKQINDGISGMFSKRKRRRNMLEVQSITVKFGGVTALDDVSAQFTETVGGIIGPNGAGKTTLMNVLSGFVLPKSGSVTRDGQDLLKLAPHRRAHWGLRRSFQREEIADDLTAFDNVMVQLDHSRASAADRSKEVEGALDFVGLSDKAGVLGSGLNTFERRLADVAKCMVGQPRIVMFDEPAGGLSIDESKRLGSLIREMAAQTGAQVLVIDHDVDLIREICVETLVLDFGKRIAFGPTDEVLNDPKVKAAYLGTEEVEA
jgi:ABC-type branched-subunit amino acid transport system ATPase component/ABC-type branched-subunit amino acid transport system permease subunit